MKASIFGIIAFFFTFGFICTMSSFRPWKNGDMTVFFQWSLLGIIGLATSAIIYAIATNKD